MSHAEITIKGVAQGHIALKSDSEPSFLNKGTGILKYDSQSDLELAHALLHVKADINGETSFESVLNHVSSATTNTNVSQAFVKYNPIWSPKYRWQFKVGMFYPEMGFENPTTGWLSPYNYTNSAINSWVGEELRTIGGEIKFTRPGRKHNSPHTFALVTSAYKANDTLGTLLAWRGWALHDKQAILNESIPFANYPSIQDTGILPTQASWVEPFREIDGNWGFYIGGHWDYRSSSRLRFYHYNNRGDEDILARGGQYAWQTIFNTVSWQYRINKNIRFISQIMDGNTAMGVGKVNVDFRAWFALVSYNFTAHRITLRFDDFKTVDKDVYKIQDDNDGHGDSVTLSYRYNWDEHWQFGIEYLRVNSFQASRMQWQWEPQITQSQVLGVVQYRF